MFPSLAMARPLDHRGNLLFCLGCQSNRVTLASFITARAWPHMPCKFRLAWNFCVSELHFWPKPRHTWGRFNWNYVWTWKISSKIPRIKKKKLRFFIYFGKKQYITKVVCIDYVTILFCWFRCLFSMIYNVGVISIWGAEVAKILSLQKLRSKPAPKNVINCTSIANINTGNCRKLNIEKYTVKQNICWEFTDVQFNTHCETS